MTAFQRRYHVPRSQVWERSRGGQHGNVHLHVLDERFDHGRIHRTRGEALCGRRGWFERSPEHASELDDDALCSRCVEIATRAGAFVS